MFYIKHFARFRLTVVQNFKRNMAKFYVRNVDTESYLDMSFEYAHGSGEGRVYNSSRPKSELVGNSLSRIAQNINKHVNKGLRKKKSADAKPIEVTVQIFHGNDLETQVAEEMTTGEAFQQDAVILIESQKYTVDVNPPTCLGITVPQTVMVEFPIFPIINFEFGNLKDSEYTWEKVKMELSENSATPNSKNKKPLEPKEVERHIVGKELQYTPSNDDIGYFLSLTCVPKSGSRIGRPLSAQTKFEVTAGPGLCPFEHRHLYTQNETGKGEMRVLSYNILADLYADQDYSRDVLYNYCPPYALSLDYRKNLIIKELKGYKADLLCLQEVDSKMFNGDLSSVLGQLGYEGVFKEKAGEVREGSAIFYRTSKFRLICEHFEVLRDFMERDKSCEDLVKKTYVLPALKEILQTRSTIVHVVALEPLDCPGRVLLLANTHLYFHPDASHIRIIQTVTAMRFIEKLAQTYKKQKPCLIFCGDFNSDPVHGVYEFMTSQSIKEDHRDWTRGGEDQLPSDMNFSHRFHLDSGCGLPQFTNYTNGFSGHLDFIYYDTESLEVVQVIPQPDLKDVEFHTALPSIVFPSDHIAQICDLKFKGPYTSNL